MTQSVERSRASASGPPRTVAAVRGLRAGRTHGCLVALLLVLFLTFLDNTIVSVVLANVQSDLHAGVSELQWVVNGYALTFASLMLAFGPLGDQLGRKRVMLGGVALFCAASVLGALAPDVHVLIAARVLMGVGAAASEPGTLSMIRHVYTERRPRARALGAWAAVAGLALALGPVIGGALAGVWSWRAIFWFNLFFGVVAFALALWTLPETSDPVRGRFDVGGLVLGAGALGTACFAVIGGETAGYSAGWVDGLFIVAIAALVTFFWRERRARNPLVNVSYLRIPPFVASNLIAFTTYFAAFALFFFCALYLQVVGSVSPYQVAVDFLPMAAAMVLASALTGRWVAAMGPRVPMTIGCLVAALGIALTDVRISPTAGFGAVGIPLALAGLGFGIVIVPVTSTALSVIPAEHSGMAASITNTSRELGAVAGVAVLGSLVNGQLTVNLVHQLAAIGIPKAYREQVVTAVTTGSFNQQAAKAAGHNAAIAVIVHKVTTAAYSAFGHGLDLSLSVAAALMVASAVVAWALVRRRHGPAVEAAVEPSLVGD